MKLLDVIARSEAFVNAFVGKFSIFWRHMPGTLGIIIVGILTTILGGALQGEWTLVLVLACKQFGINIPASASIQDEGTGLLENIGLKDVRWHILINIASSTLIYVALGGFLQWYFYVRQKDEPEKWKCQPKRFLSHEDAVHEFALGAFNTVLGAVVFAVVSCYIANGGYTTVYYDPLERGWVYLVLSTVGLFLYEDGCFYYYHRMLHWPFVYKTLHKVHHRYKAPTCFSSNAMHPVEFLGFQVFITLPVFLFPINAGVYVGMLLYLYYFGMICHSGIKLDSIYPWQPPVMFHDDHHKYANCNFGFNLMIFDKLHGTLRRKDGYYDVGVFEGKGRRQYNPEEKKLKSEETMAY